TPPPAWAPALGGGGPLPPVGGRGPPRAGEGSGAEDLHHTKENCPKMARLSGVDLPREKRLEIALTYVYGIGRTRATETLAATGVSGDTRVHALTEVDLRREVAGDIRRKIEIGCYQGIRHRKGLPVHGQRTQTNARTRKGKKKTVAGKKKAGKK